MRERQRTVAKTVSWGVVVAFLGVVLLPALLPGQRGPSPSEPAAQTALLEFLRAPACLVPVLVVSLSILGFITVYGYYGIQRLEAQRRIWLAEAADHEEQVRQMAVQTARRRQELNDLTVNLATGEEVARLLQGPEGELLLVRPGLATKPVSRLDPDAVTEESEQVRVAAMLANATRYGQGQAASGKGGGNLSLELAALAMLNPGGTADQRLPGRVRILDDEELRMLEEDRQDA
jgi:hypothetical protein